MATEIKSISAPPSNKISRNALSCFIGGKWFVLNKGEEYLHVAISEEGEVGAMSRWVCDQEGTYVFSTLSDDEEGLYRSLLSPLLGYLVQCESGRHAFTAAPDTVIAQRALEGTGLLIICGDDCPHCQEALRRRAFDRANDARRFNYIDYRRMVGMAAAL